MIGEMKKLSVLHHPKTSNSSMRTLQEAVKRSKDLTSNKILKNLPITELEGDQGLKTVVQTSELRIDLPP